jgi:hypothetical protein
MAVSASRFQIWRQGCSGVACTEVIEGEGLEDIVVKSKWVVREYERGVS